MNKVIFFLKQLLSKFYRKRLIAQVPITISKRGYYYLKQNLTVDDPTLSGITINADNVIIDLKGYIIEAASSGDSHGAGIQSYGHSRIVIKNGTLKKFMYGIRIQDKDLEKLKSNSPYAMKHIYVSNIECDSTTFRGVFIQAQFSSVIYSKFKSITGTRLFPNSFAMAIEVSGQECHISKNTIDDVYPIGTGEGVGISLSSFGDGGRIIDNSISNNLPSLLGRTFGIWVGKTDLNDVHVINNVLTNLSYGIGMNKLKGQLFNNQFNDIRCADYFGKDREYYLNKTPSFEENNSYIVTQAAKGDPNFLFKLGIQYMEGLWVDKDDIISALYLRQAAELGHEEASRLIQKHF